MTDSESDRHQAARIWFEDQMNSGVQIGLPWFTLVSFLRLATQQNVRTKPMLMDEALEWVHEWLEWQTVWIPEPTPRHGEVLRELLRVVPRSRMVNDAHIAAIAIEHGLTLCSADAGFKMFTGLKSHNPLQ
ncbi:MAG: TA system VapC family ribonuclease toxin [Acidimicrobiia bacterium]